MTVRVKALDEALAAERALFAKLVASDQSRAQRHLFFAEREAAKLPGKDTPKRRIARVGVIGGGTMCGGIAARPSSRSASSS